MHATQDSDMAVPRGATSVRRCDLDRDFAAVLLCWADGTVPEDRTGAFAIRRRLEALSAASVHVAVITDLDATAIDQQLHARPKGPGRFFLFAAGHAYSMTETGAREIPGADDAVAKSRMTLVLEQFAALGVGAGLVLVVGGAFGRGHRAADLIVPAAMRAEFVSIGPAEQQPVAVVGDGQTALRGVLDGVLARRANARVPDIDDDPEWVLCETSADVARQRVSESLFTLAGAGIGPRGAVEEAGRGHVALTVAAGVYTGSGPDQHLLPGPRWTGLELDPPPARDTRLLDLRTGMLVRTEDGAQEIPLRTARFASQTTPGLMVMRAECGPKRLTPGPALTGGDSYAQARPGRQQWRSTVRGSTGTHVHAVASQQEHRGRSVHVLDRMAVYAVNGHDLPGLLVDRLLGAADRLGFDQLLADNRTAWARRWENVDVRIPADPAAQLAARFALFQLWSHTGRYDELALGARGLTGVGYSGHVFWDADVFVLPALATIDPAAARALVLYRHARVAAARTRAIAEGHPGARFPWESAADGMDVTPSVGQIGGRSVAVRTGELEEHISADVAWGADFCAHWHGDEVHPGSEEADLIVETARYWAGRCRLDDTGHAHIDHVIGPDEYHEDVSDNAFTNVMARWNLRAAARLVGDAEARQWAELADRLVDGYDERTGLYEQFAGYFALEPVLVTDIAAPPVAADVLLGSERLAATQVIKQPDVLMLHHLVPEETVAGSLTANLDFYAPRTAHGSSLSPAMSALLLARGGRPDEALDLLRIALTLDLEDRTGTTAAGLHLATLGGVWQALLFGFAGARVVDGCLHLDPRLPSAWPELELRFLAVGCRVRLRIDRGGVRVWSDGAMRVRPAGGPEVQLPGEREVQVSGAGGEGP
jgi:trehalose/maltose hydrolase-like predicted phosphorylase